MRYTKKRLTVINDGFCNCKKPASERIDAVINRYVKKMDQRGWIPYCAPTAGNAFTVYEAYVRLCKPLNDDEKKEMESRALESFWTKKENEVFVWA